MLLTPTMTQATAVDQLQRRLISCNRDTSNRCYFNQLQQWLQLIKVATAIVLFVLHCNKQNNGGCYFSDSDTTELLQQKE